MTVRQKFSAFVAVVAMFVHSSASPQFSSVSEFEAAEKLLFAKDVGSKIKTSNQFFDLFSPRLVPCEMQGYTAVVAGVSRLSEAALDVAFQGGWLFRQLQLTIGTDRMARLLAFGLTEELSTFDIVELPTVGKPSSEGENNVPRQDASARFWPLKLIFAPNSQIDAEARIQHALKAYARISLKRVSDESKFPGIAVLRSRANSDAFVAPMFCDYIDRTTLFEPWNDPGISEHQNDIGLTVFSGSLGVLNLLAEGMKFGSQFVPESVFDELEAERVALSSALPEEFKSRLGHTILDFSYYASYDYFSQANDGSMRRQYDSDFTRPAGVDQAYALVVRIPTFSIRRSLLISTVTLDARLQSAKDRFIDDADGQRFLDEIWNAAIHAREQTIRRLDFAIAHEEAHHYLGKLGNIETNEEKVDCFALWNLAIAGRPLELGEAELILDVNPSHFPQDWARHASKSQQQKLQSRLRRLKTLMSHKWTDPAAIRAECERPGKLLLNR